MRGTSLFIVLILFSVIISSCRGKGGNLTATMPLRGDGKGFTENQGDAYNLELVQYNSSYSLQFGLQQEGRVTFTTEEFKGGLKVNIFVEEAKNLFEVYFDLRFNPSLIYPYQIDEGDFLKQDGIPTLFLGILNQWGFVPVGMIRIRPQDNGGVSGNGRLATIYFRSYAASDQPKLLKSAPTQNYNQVNNLTVTKSGPNAVLDWTEKNRGDFDLDGIVKAADVSPIAFNFGTNVTGGLPFLIDSEGNQTNIIDAGDLSAVAFNFANRIDAYNIYRADNPGPLPTFNLLGTQNRPDPLVAPKDRRAPYQFTNSNVAPGSYIYKVVPFSNPDSTEGIASIEVPYQSSVSMSGLVIEVDPAPGNDLPIVITDLALDGDPLNDEPFTKISTKLIARADIGSGMQDVSNMVVWDVANNDFVASVNNSDNKGLVTGKDVGIATIRAYNPDSVQQQTTLDISVYAVLLIEIGYDDGAGNIIANDLNLPPSNQLQFVAHLIFSNGFGDLQDLGTTVELAGFVTWLQYPQVTDPNAFFDMSSAGLLTVNDPLLFLTGDYVVVYAEMGNTLIRNGYKATSNPIKVSIP